MKTTNNVQKTENRNFKLSSVKFLAALPGILFLTFFAGASELEKRAPGIDSGVELTETIAQKSDFVGYAELTNNAITFSTSKMNRANSTMRFLEQERENDLEIENWMTNDAYFSSDKMSFETEKEEAPEIENWMTGETYFINPALVTETEPTLKTEAWMLNENFWTK